VGENFGGVGTARKLAEKTLAVDKMCSLFSRAHETLKLLADKTLADWQ